MTPACSMCRFSSPTRDGIECRRYPPQVATDVDGEIWKGDGSVTTSLIPFFPDVGDDWWCGEFQSRGAPSSEVRPVKTTTLP